MISFWKQVRPKIVVEHDLAVVCLARVDVEEEAAGGGEDAVGLDHAGMEVGDEVVEGVIVAGRQVAGGARDLARDGWFGAVAMASEAGAVALRVADGADASAMLAAPGVEGRVDVDERDGAAGERLEDGEVVPVHDLIDHLVSHQHRV